MPTDIKSKYAFGREFGGGKSGAYVFQVTDRRLGKTRILKMYPGTLGEDLSVKNDRPLREIYTLCKMSGTPGFPKVYDKGISVKLPEGWHTPPKVLHKGYSLQETIKRQELLDDPNVPFVVMSMASGATLSKLDLKTVAPPSKLLKIADELLDRLLTARTILGEHFQHFDMHPDNIYVDFTQTPSVVLIDFDLVRSNAFETAPLNAYVSKKPLEDHRKKLTDVISPIPERTLNFILKWMPKQKALELLLQLGNARKNTDVRNWMAILGVFAYLLNVEKKVVFCEGIHHCKELNKTLLERAHETLLQHESERLAFRTGAETPPSQEQKSGLNNVISTFIGQEGSEELMEAVHSLDARLYREKSQRVNQDMLALLFEVDFRTPAHQTRAGVQTLGSTGPEHLYVRIDKGAHDTNYLELDCSAFTVSVTGKALTPKIEVKFTDGPGLGISVYAQTREKIVELMAKYVDTVAGNLTGSYKLSCTSFSDFLTLLVKGLTVQFNSHEGPGVSKNGYHVFVNKVIIELFLGVATEITIHFTTRYPDWIATLNSIATTFIGPDVHFGLTYQEDGSYIFRIVLNGAGEPHVCIKAYNEHNQAIRQKMRRKCGKAIALIQSSLISTIESLDMKFNLQAGLVPAPEVRTCRLQALDDDGHAIVEQKLESDFIQKLLGSKATIEGLANGTTTLTPLIALNMARRIIGLKILNGKGSTTASFRNGASATVPFTWSSGKDFRDILGSGLVDGAQGAAGALAGAAVRGLAKKLPGVGALASRYYSTLSGAVDVHTESTRPESTRRTTSYEFPADDADSTGYTATSVDRSHKLFHAMQNVGDAARDVGHAARNFGRTAQDLAHTAGQEAKKNVSKFKKAVRERTARERTARKMAEEMAAGEMPIVEDDTTDTEESPKRPITRSSAKRAAKGVLESGQRKVRDAFRRGFSALKSKPNQRKTRRAEDDERSAEDDEATAARPQKQAYRRGREALVNK